MKLKKFLSIAVDCMEGNKENQNAGTTYDADTLYHAMDELQEYLEIKGYHRPVEAEKTMANITVCVKTEQGEGAISQVKFIPMEEQVNLETFSYVAGNLKFYRFYTIEDGSLSCQLPVGRYFMEITKGSEYGIIKDEITIVEGSNQSFDYQLSQFVSMKDSGWYAGDLHHHSVYSSPLHGGTDPVVETPKEVSLSMQAMGLSFGALSDHHNTKNHKEWEKCKSKDFTPILSKEISTSNGHVLSLGVGEDVIYDIPKDEDRSDEYLRSEFIRITNRIKELGGLPQLNHPRDHQRAISWNPAYYDMIDIFQTIEIWNGSNPMMEGTPNSEAGQLWVDLLEAGRYIPATTGSDTHNIKANDYGDYLARLNWMIPLIRTHLQDIPQDVKGPAGYLVMLYDNIIPTIEKWAKSTLSSGCVRNYVYSNKEVSTEALLEGLKKGNSFLTDGPILIPTIDGKIPGDIVTVDKKEIDIHIQLQSNRPLKQLLVYKNGNRKEVYALEEQKMDEKGMFDYSRILEQIAIKDTKWMFFVAYSDCTNLAITNPIFITGLF